MEKMGYIPTAKRISRKSGCGKRFQFSLTLESQLFILACNRPLFFSLLCCALAIWLLGDWSSVNNDEVDIR
ncbi:hypothetical protein OUZ56_008746 [Daphnia magna]|uniref:Uncharacterized protein n=1 Tax=Daphnia magna TaxID=35525 RepID=A0ABR0ADY7_9CRUS|nr:hypothetical protein OUZ56_008746 [Daphnia magna]